MNELEISCASTDRKSNAWDSIDWLRCEIAVKKLQARIVKAQKEGRYGKVKALQWMLTHSFYAKALAVKRVTSNKGKKTAGVDPKSEVSGNQRTETQGIQSPTVETGLYQQKERQTTAVGYSYHERQGYAGAVSDGIGAGS